MGKITSIHGPSPWPYKEASVAKMFFTETSCKDKHQYQIRSLTGPIASLSREQVRCIRERRGNKETFSKIAKDIGKSQHVVRDAALGLGVYKGI